MNFFSTSVVAVIVVAASDTATELCRLQWARGFRSFGAVLVQLINVAGNFAASVEN